LEGQIEAFIQAFFSIPKSASQVKKAKMLSGDIRPTKKPDWDNIGKVVCDALNNLAYGDDSHVVSGTVYKWYSEEPRIVVELIGQEVITSLKGERPAKKTRKKAK
jgi:Holliday junction resolvase RusA-like endonuclease